MDRIEINVDDDFSLDLEDLLKSPIPNFFDDNELFGDAFFQNSEAACSFSNVTPIQVCSPSLDATKEEQQTNVMDLKSSLGEITPILNINEPRQHEQRPAMTTSTNIIIGNDDNEYSEYTMNDLFDLAEASSSNPQQNIIKSMPPTTFPEYPNTNTCMGGSYQVGMSLSTCYGRERQPLSFDGILSRPIQTPNLMPTLRPNYQNNNLRPHNMHNGFCLYDYKPTNWQVLQNMHPQQQQSNDNSLSAVCNGTNPLAPNISTPQTSTFKAGCISAEEKKEKIERYRNKRKRRNFSKKIKYASRKTLADSRPRVRGRFAKNDETEHMARACSTNCDDLQPMTRASTSNQDRNNIEVAINDGDLFDSFDLLDQSNNNSLDEPGFDPLNFLILDG